MRPSTPLFHHSRERSIGSIRPVPEPTRLQSGNLSFCGLPQGIHLALRRSQSRLQRGVAGQPTFVGGLAEIVALVRLHSTCSSRRVATHTRRKCEVAVKGKGERGGVGAVMGGGSLQNLVCMPRESDCVVATTSEGNTLCQGIERRSVSMLSLLGDSFAARFYIGVAQYHHRRHMRIAIACLLLLLSKIALRNSSYSRRCNNIVPT